MRLQNLMTALNIHVYHIPVNFHFNPINLVRLHSVSKFTSTKLCYMYVVSNR